MVFGFIWIIIFYFFNDFVGHVSLPRVSVSFRFRYRKKNSRCSLTVLPGANEARIYLIISFTTRSLQFVGLNFVSVYSSLNFFFFLHICRLSCVARWTCPIRLFLLRQANCTRVRCALPSTFGNTAYTGTCLMHWRIKKECFRFKQQ